MALVSSYTIPLLLELLQAGKLDTSAMITHGELALHPPPAPGILNRRLTSDLFADFKFSDIEKAYDTFGRAAETKALKLNIEFD